jgi:hypothetical protein
MGLAGTHRLADAGWPVVLHGYVDDGNVRLRSYRLDEWADVQVRVHQGLDDLPEGGDVRTASGAREAVSATLEKESALEMAIKEEGAARAIYVGAVVDDVLAQTDAEDDSDRDLCHRRKVEAESKHSASIDRLVEESRKTERALIFLEHEDNCSCSTECWMCNHKDRP